MVRLVPTVWAPFASLVLAMVKSKVCELMLPTVMSWAAASFFKDVEAPPAVSVKSAPMACACEKVRLLMT